MAGLLERWRHHLRRECDAGSASMVSYVVAAALFIVGSSFLLHFVIQPPGNSTTGLEHLELRSKADDALGLLVGTPGVPLSWDASAAEIDAVKRLGLVENGASIRLDADKFDALAKGKLTTASSSNAGIDYAEAKAGLGLSGYEFHLRAYPLIQPTDDDPYGLSDFDDFRIAYVGDFSGGAPTAYATPEIAQIDGLNVDFTYDSSQLVTDDVIPDDSGSVRSELLPLIGANVQQTIISSGAGLSHQFFRVPASTYSALAPPAAGLTRGLAVSHDGATLGYTKNLEVRAIVGKADLTDVSLASLTWKEYVDTDKGNLSYDCQDYGYVEVSPDFGQTWYALSNTGTARSDDCSSPLELITPHGAVMTTRTIADITATCAACDDNDAVLIGYHWVADNDNTMGYGWVIDDVQVSTLATTIMKKTFEDPEYDMLIIGSNIDNHAFEPEDVKEALRDYVDRYGGRVMITGPATNVNWLDRLFDAGIAGTSAGISTPDVTHPLLTLPNVLNYNAYPKPPVTWDFTGSNDASLFSAVMAESDQKHVLSVSRLGAWGDGSTDEGSVILSSFEPYRFSTTEEARKFFANGITYGKFHYLYIDYGPAVPEGQAVASATRTATMNMHRTGEASYTEMAFILYVWPGASTAATASAVTVPASPPLSPSATASPTTVTLHWTYPASNGSANPVQFVVYRGYSPDSATTQIGTVAYPAPWTPPNPLSPTTTFTYVDTPVANGATYYYTIRLETTGGALGTPSTVVSGTPIGPPGAPSTSGAPTATGMAGKVRAQWTAPTDTGGGTIFGYRVYGATDGATYNLLGEIGNVTTYDHPVSDSTAWSFKVEALNAYSWGTRSAASPSATAVLPIAAPTLSVASGAGPNNLTLTWVAPDVVGQTLAGYRILRADDNAGTPGTFAELTYIANPAAVTFTDTSLGINVTKHYKIQGVTEYGDGLLSTSQSAKTLGTPDTPTWGTIVRTPVANTRTLAWNAVVVSDWPVVRYDVYRGLTASDTLILIGSSTTTGYVDTPGAGTFYYAVKAVSAAGSSDASARLASLPASIPAPTLTVTTGTGANNLTLVWTAPAVEPGVTITGYQIARATASSGPYTDLTPVSGTPPFTDTGLGVNATRYYKVYATTTDGNSATSDVMNAKTMATPNTPTWVSVVKTPVTNVRTLTWVAPTSDAAIARYDVYRASSANGALTLIGGTTAGTVTYVDSPGPGAFWYVVRAVSYAGASDESARYQST